MDSKESKGIALPKTEGEWISYNLAEDKWNPEGFIFVSDSTAIAYRIHVRLDEQAQLQLMVNEDVEMTDFYRRKAAVR